MALIDKDHSTDGAYNDIRHNRLLAPSIAWGLLVLRCDTFNCTRYHLWLRSARWIGYVRMV